MYVNHQDLKIQNFPDKVYKVKKALYGLHQAPKLGMKLVKLICWTIAKKELCFAFKKLMHEKFQMSSMGELTFFLGLQVNQKKDGIFICQDKYIGEILKKFGSMIWFLMYLTSQGPDICLQWCACARLPSIPKVFTSSCCEKGFLGPKALISESTNLIWAKTINGEVQLHVLVDGKKIILTEALVRRDLQLEDKEDEAVHKELGDSLVRAATTASSLEAEHDSGLRMYLNIPMIHCSQENEIDSLKRRVKKLEKKRSSRTHKLKRLYKVGLTARVESSRDEEDLGKDASKQGRRINVIDADEDITLVNVQDDADNEMFDVNVLNDEEVFIAGQNENVVEEVVDAAQVSTTATTVTITTKEITLAQALEALKTSKPKVKGIVFQEPSTTTTITTISSQQSQDKGKGIMIEEHVKPMKKKVQIMLDEEAALKLQAEFDKEERLAREKAEKEKEANIVLIEEWDDIQAKIAMVDSSILKKQKVDDDQETTELKQCMEIITDEEEVTIDAIPLAVKIFSQMLKSFNMEDLEDLYKLVKARYGSTRPVESIDYLLWNDMKIMFEPHVEDEVWKLQNGYKVLEWKMYDSCGVHFLRMQSMQIYMLVEKKYPLTPPILSMMLEKKLQIDYESEMAYQLYKLIIKQLKK
ncbi:putative ribonuclease H-like domain-containing protein [Tanacetum coccineum]